MHSERSTVEWIACGVSSWQFRDCLRAEGRGSRIACRTRPDSWDFVRTGREGSSDIEGADQKENILRRLGSPDRFWRYLLKSISKSNLGRRNAHWSVKFELIYFIKAYGKNLKVSDKKHPPAKLTPWQEELSAYHFEGPQNWVDRPGSSQSALHSCDSIRSIGGIYFPGALSGEF